MAKYFIGALVIILLIGSGYYLSRRAAVGPSSATSVELATTTYSSADFSVDYPKTYSIDPSYTNTSVNPKKPIAGVKFTIPGSMASSTNLSPDTYIAVESLPRAKNCTGDIYLAENVKPQTVDDNGVQYSVASSSGAAAGNIYEEQVWAVADSKPCTAVRYFIHSGNIGNYPEGTVREFDRAALLSQFDAVRRSLRLGGTAEIGGSGSSPAVGIANPASTNCNSLGGTLEIRDEQNGQAGYCHLTDGRVCEEWALFRDKTCVAPR